MKKKHQEGPLPWSPYPIQGMSAREADPLLWKPQVVHSFPYMPSVAYEYGIPVRLDPRTMRALDTEHTWLTVAWLVQKRPGPAGIQALRGQCKVMIHGIDDTNYGVWLTSRTHKDFMEAWYAIRAFIWINDIRLCGLNGTKLIEYCEATLGAYERDYN